MVDYNNNEFSVPYRHFATYNLVNSFFFTEYNNDKYDVQIHRDESF